MGQLKIILWLLAGMLLISGVLALLSPDFAAGFRDGFLDGMNRDLNRIGNLLRSPMLKWLLVLASMYFLSFVPLMWLSARGVISSKITVRVYFPIWIMIGIAVVALEHLRPNANNRNDPLD
jgi:hypothetical protein